MPEIKHNFLKGKMNKDLDERLVANGEYRDAVNVQVSTSEGSDVGTLQNILGNSLVTGQDFLPSNLFCVGSIANEKNNKLYYFITQKNLLPDGQFDKDAFYWSPTGGWDVTAGKATGVDQVQGYITSSAPGVVGSSGGGDTYRMYYEIVVAGTRYSNVILKNHTTAALGYQTGGGDVKLPNTHVKGIHYVDWVQGPANNGRIQIYGGNDFTGTIDNISVINTNVSAVNFIIEYDSVTKVIRPIFVDEKGDVLNFSSQRLITGINIIDDLLFWTDNYSEPKKINIKRSIKGTDVSGTIHTKFVNEKTDLQEDIREEHITVIKKNPYVAPEIELVSERAYDGNYSGVMRITSAPNPPLVKYTENANNDSSMWISAIASTNYLYDFSQLNVGSLFSTQIETDIEGNSGFVLDWNVGDTLLFKEFEGQDNSEPPSIPLQEFSLKAKIVSLNASDYITELLPNGDFLTPQNDGSAPDGWDFDSQKVSYQFGVVSPSYNADENRIEYRNDAEFLTGDPLGDGTTAGNVLYGVSFMPPVVDFVAGSTYRVTFTISNWESGFFRPILVTNTDFLGQGGTNEVYYFRGPGNVSSSFKGFYKGTSGGGPETFTYDIPFVYGSGVQYDWPNSWVGKFVIYTDRDTGAEFDLDSVSVELLDAQNASVGCEVLAFGTTPPVVPPGVSSIKFAVDKLDQEEKIFETKFPRIAYRYKYQDGEYSAISPFSSIAFLPGIFNYHATDGFNLGMVNRITQIKVKNFKTNLPKGVVEIDIIYKEDSSTNLYIVDTIKPTQGALTGSSSNHWSKGEYVIKSEQVNTVIESNQLLRPWDNVPKKALAQEISGNRIIYGNYVQGNDLKANTSDYYPDFNFDINSSNFNYGTKTSVKSLREYQLGAVFIDKQGRETPVISNLTGAKKLTKQFAKDQNKLQVEFRDSIPPDGFKFVKFFIKETSGEYYNLAMDRHYQAEDKQLWLSFPSSDRNKISEDDFLILKKGIESNEAVTQEAKYKVLDIQSEPPEFVKSEKLLIDNISHLFSDANRNLFGDNMINAPALGLKEFKVSYRPFSRGSSRNFQEIDEALYVEFKSNITGKVSERYEVNSVGHDWQGGSGAVSLDDSKYTFRIKKSFGDDINFITDDDSGLSPSKIQDNIALRVYKYSPKNAAKFDGKFFVKIDIDQIISDKVLIDPVDPEYKTTVSKKLFMMRDNHDELHREELMFGSGALGEYGGGSSPGHGRIAPFFRNYNSKPSSRNLTDHDGSTIIEAGQYVFGDRETADTDVLDTNNAWANELAWVTTFEDVERGSSTSTDEGSGLTRTFPGGETVATQNFKTADHHGWTNKERYDNSVWFIDQGKYHGARSCAQYGFSMHWEYTSANINTCAGLLTWGSSNRMHLSIGGIFHPQTDPTGTIDHYHDVGFGNPAYDYSGAKDFSNKLSGGEKFRFKEDPTNEIYTVLKIAGIIGLINHTASSPNRTDWPYPTISEADAIAEGWLGGSYAFLPGGGYAGIYDYTDADYVDTNADFTKLTALLSPNYRTRFDTSFLDSNGEHNINWNPADALGPIANGLILTINHSTTAATWANVPFIVVDTLAATNHDGGTYNIQEGMILTSHSNGTHTLEGAPLTAADAALLVYRIVPHTASNGHAIYLCGYARPMVSATVETANSEYIAHEIFDGSHDIEVGEALVFKQPTMNGYSQFSCNRINAQLHTIDSTAGVYPNPTLNPGVYQFDDKQSGTSGYPRIMPVSYTLEFVEQIDREASLPSNPAIWETHPKENTPLDIYYEASGYNPLLLEEDTKYIALPTKSVVRCVEHPSALPEGMTIKAVHQRTLPQAGETEFAVGMEGTGSWRLRIGKQISSNKKPIVELNGNYLDIGNQLVITRLDGSDITVKVTGWDASEEMSGTATYPAQAEHIYIEGDLYDARYTLNWHNCFSFGNGVESNRVKDNFNLPFITNGVKVSATTTSSFEGEEHRKYGLIYSGIYNSNSSTNNLNQFIAAEKITKDINPTYGSIQKLHARDTDLITLCENKCLKILSDKDAVFNADGNPQLTANERVLGQTIPFVGEFGISKNPESFASEAYRIYFTDKTRGAVMRLSRDGLSPISDYGMKDWFRDNLKLSKNLVGSYDKRNDQYNITIEEIPVDYPIFILATAPPIVPEA